MGSLARFSLEALLSVTAGTSGGSSAGTSAGLKQPAGVSTDTRTLEAGDFYLPLSGEKFDGHDFLAKAFEMGAAGAFVDAKKLAANPAWQAYPNLVAVDDTLSAYLRLARFHRKRCPAKLVGITGSSGKTTTKDMLFAALSPLAPTQRSEKNFNNEIGLCQTLLSLKPETKFLLVEMAMRGLHQIELLSEYAQPDLAIVVNVGPAHIGLLGSLENIALAKCEIFSHMDVQHGIGVINADDALLSETARRVWKGRLETFSLAEAENVTTTQSGEMEFVYRNEAISLNVPGWHNVANALAILKAGTLLGFSVSELKAGLETFQGGDGRWGKSLLTGFHNAWVINDAYNANPDSLKASLKTFLEMDAPGLNKIMVIGGMKELGEETETYHRAIGEWLAEASNLQMLFTVGEEAKEIFTACRALRKFPVFHAGDLDALMGIFKTSGLSFDNAIVLLKGSRSYHLEEIPARLSQGVPAS